MAIVRTQINCPNCKQPITADIEQLFDTAADPAAKQRLLSGAFNRAQCPHCGYNGALSTPIVYHDADKELLLTFFPPELNVSRNDQEAATGKLIKQVVDNLPTEQRKGYLFSPQSTLTLQGLLERVLEEDGITKEMIEDQQKRVGLIQRLMAISDDSLEETAKNEDEQIDAQFFSLLGQLIQSTLSTGDREGAEKLSTLHEKLIESTTFGQQLKEESKKVEAAVKTLQDAGKELTREKLLDIVSEHSEESQLNALVSLARPGMDYEFFQMLTGRIDAAEGDEKESLTALRDTLLEMTKQIDEQLASRMAVASQNLDTLLGAEDIKETVKHNLPAIDDFFLQALNDQYETAMQAEDKDRLAKLQQVVDVIQELTTPGGALLQELLEAEDDAALDEMLEAHKAEITSSFVESLTGVLMQLEGGENLEAADKVRKIYRKAVRMSMKAGMQAGPAE
ncbi:MAG: CpXC domain-containing protein [Anaerolineae bacterium]|nr:CpXC domain-containing protein [Anaerolineae bacterium]